MSSKDEKIHTCKSEICRSEKLILREYELENTMFSLEEHFAVPIDEAAIDVTFICKHFHALTIITELNRGCYLTNQYANNIYKFI